MRVVPQPGLPTAQVLCKFSLANSANSSTWSCREWSKYEQSAFRPGQKNSTFSNIWSPSHFLRFEVRQWWKIHITKSQGPSDLSDGNADFDCHEQWTHEHDAYVSFQILLSNRSHVQAYAYPFSGKWSHSQANVPPDHSPVLHSSTPQLNDIRFRLRKFWQFLERSSSLFSISIPDFRSEPEGALSIHISHPHILTSLVFMKTCGAAWPRRRASMAHWAAPCGSVLWSQQNSPSHEF